jgi:hypothetical protein
VNIRSRANTTRGLDFEHMIKARAHKGGVRIGLSFLMNQRFIFLGL